MMQNYFNMSTHIVYATHEKTRGFYFSIDDFPLIAAHAILLCSQVSLTGLITHHQRYLICIASETPMSCVFLRKGVSCGHGRLRALSYCPVRYYAHLWQKHKKVSKTDLLNKQYTTQKEEIFMSTVHFDSGHSIGQT